MACACRGKAGTKKFVYTSPTGQTKTYQTEIEAKAAQVRQGGSYVVK